MTPVSEIQDQVGYVKSLIHLGFPVMPASDSETEYRGPEAALTAFEAERHYRDAFNASGVAIVLGEEKGRAAVRFQDLGTAETWAKKNAAESWPCFAGPEGVILIAKTDEFALDEILSEPGAELITSGSLSIPSRASDHSRRWLNPPRISHEDLNEVLHGQPQGGSELSPNFPGATADFSFPHRGACLKAIKGSEYLRRAGIVKRKWLIEDFLPEAYQVIWSGNSKAGKSTLLTALALAVAKGEPFLDRKVTQGNVLWMAYEESFQERVETLQFHGELPDAFLVCHDQIPVNTPEGIRSFRQFIVANEIKLLILDPLYVAVQVDSLTDGKKARDSFQPFKLLLNEQNVSAIFIHHLTKSVKQGMIRERAADSGQIIAAASQDVLMETRINADRTRQIFLRSTGRGEFANNDYEIHSKSPTDFELIQAGPPGTIEMNNLPKAIMDHLRATSGGVTGDDIAESIGVAPASTKNALTGLSKSGKIKVDKEARPYKYSI